MPRKSRYSSLQIVFVDPSGKQTKGPIITRKCQRATRSLNHDSWNHKKAIQRFLWYLPRGDQQGLEAACKALIHQKCLSEALMRCMHGDRPNIHKIKSLLSLWNTYGLWSIPQSLGNDLAVFTDAIRYFAPPYEGPPIILYRGQSRSRYEQGIFGIAWTARVAIAKQFSGIRDTEGVVLELNASPDLIVVHVPDFISTCKTNPNSGVEYEDEYLVDPRALTGRVRVHPLS
jgi:hypothetical protein